MTKFAILIPGSMFSVPADADGVIYTLNADRSVSAEGMVTMTADEAVAAFAGAELIVNAAPSVKSIMPVRLYGSGNNGNWAVRARLSDGIEIFLGHGNGYSLATAQSAMDNTRHCMADYRPLPAGVTVKA